MTSVIIIIIIYSFIPSVVKIPGLKHRLKPSCRSDTSPLNGRNCKGFFEGYWTEVQDQDRDSLEQALFVF